MKTILMTAILATSAFAQITAYWTGESKLVQTVSYKWVWNCKYRLPNGQYFWRLMPENTTCKQSLTVY